LAALPVLLVAAEDPKVRESVLDELSRYRRDYELEATDCRDAALVRLRELDESGVAVAMVLGHVAPSSGGIELLAEVRHLAPTARRVLLLDWGLRPEQVAGLPRAASRGLVDVVLTRPTGPRDEDFHTAITEELADFAWTAPPVVDAVRIVVDDDTRRRGREVQDLLERLGAPTRLHAPDSVEGREVRGRAVDVSALPLVEVMRETVLSDPSQRDIAIAFGATADVGRAVFDVAIVGAGPAGMAAAVYASSEGLTTLVIEPEAFGGQAGTSSMIRNYLGFPRGITGRQLARRAALQAARLGAAIDLGRGVSAFEPGSPHRLTLSDGAVARARAVILACGVTYRRLGVESLERLVGAGVFYGASTSQAREMEGDEVVVLGAGNSGGQAAVDLARYAASVAIVTRGESLEATMSKYLVDEIAARPSIKVCVSSEVVEGGGDGALEWVDIENRASGERARVPASGLFVLIGTESRTSWLPPAVERDDRGFVLTGGDIDSTAWPLTRPPFAFETSVPGVFAAGDVRANDVKRVAAAVGEGAVAVPMVHRFLAEISRESGAR
jgi:thioredoxin reductase (NADPH)